MKITGNLTQIFMVFPYKFHGYTFISRKISDNNHNLQQLPVQIKSSSWQDTVPFFIHHGNVIHAHCLYIVFVFIPYHNQCLIQCFLSFRVDFSVVRHPVYGGGFFHTGEICVQRIPYHTRSRVPVRPVFHPVRQTPQRVFSQT